MDTAYSSMYQDTPSSFWQTPQYQDTPCTPSLTHSRPGTPSQCEKTPNESTLINSASSVPFIQSTPNISQLQPDHVTQLASSKPSIIQGAVQNFWKLGGAPCQNGSFSNRQRTPGHNPHLSNHVRRGHRVRPLESKFQNAYNRRPQHHYIHRPVYRGAHYRSGSTANQLPFRKFQEAPPTPSHSDKLTGQNFTGSIKGLSVNHRYVGEDPPSLPNLDILPQKAIGVDVRHILPDIQIHANKLENNFSGTQEPCKATHEVNQNHCPPQGQSSHSYTPNCVIPLKPQTIFQSLQCTVLLLNLNLLLWNQSLTAWTLASRCFLVVEVQFCLFWTKKVQTQRLQLLKSMVQTIILNLLPKLPAPLLLVPQMLS